MSPADLVLLVANVVYGTSYVAVRAAVDDLGPVTLAFVRLAIASALLAPAALLCDQRTGRRPTAAGDRWAFFWMGLVGFTLAMALSHSGLARSTATNGALLIAVEPIALIALSPVLLGERLTRREATATVLALVGATLVVVNGIPGVTLAVVPHCRGDLLLLLSGICYAAYSLLGRPVLARHPSVVITGLGYFVWNYALERVTAARAAIFLNLQPLVGAILGVVLLGEEWTACTVTGGAAILVGLWLALTGRPAR